jgi:hypothetical protein
LRCTICEERKEKRFCLAVHGRICAQCCGEQREVTLDCPSECPYLMQARTHAKIQNEPPDQFDPAALFPEVEIDEQFLHRWEELVVGLSFALAKSARADRDLMDRDLIAATSSLARSYKTLVNSHLIYEQPTANLAHQAITREVEAMVEEFREAERQHRGEMQGRPHLRDSDVLKTLVFVVRMGFGHTSGRPKSRAFVDFLFEQFPEKHSALAGPDEARNRIVIP